MKITDCHEINGVTILFLSEERPLSNWNKLMIDGIAYDPIPIMDAGEKCIAIHGVHDLSGKEIEFK